MRPTNLRTLMESSATTMTRSCSTRSMASAGMVPQAAALAGFGGDHAIQVDQENQAAVGCDGCAGEELDAAQILAEVLDDNFVLADDFLDNQADLAIADVGHDHAKVAVDWFERW